MIISKAFFQLEVKPKILFPKLLTLNLTLNLTLKFNSLGVGKVGHLNQTSSISAKCTSRVRYTSGASLANAVERVPGQSRLARRVRNEKTAMTKISHSFFCPTLQPRVFQLCILTN